MLHLTKLNPGMILGDQYQIIREIARGGMGIVYEAYDNDVHRKVAIKVILANKVDSIQLKRFQKEIEACVRLSHPNVVRIYDSGTYDNNPYIVMEYIEGVNICQYVAQHDQAYAQNNLGNFYYNEKYVKQDFLKAFILYEKSANQGNMYAQSNLGILYENGKGVKKDLEKAKYWYEKSANQGFTKAQNSLGRMYEKGQGVKQDLEKAKYWYEKAKQNK